MKKKENKKKGLVKTISLIVAIIVVLLLIATLCYGYIRKFTYRPENPVATIEVKDYGTIKVELYPDVAPNTVSNFIALANNEFYDGLTFHRIIKDFMIQGGGNKSDGTGEKAATLSYVDSSIKRDSDNDKEYNINGEFIENKYDNNTLKLEKGVIAMARGDYSNYAAYYGSSITEEGYNSAGSQFFIMTTDDNVSLTGYYAGFGKVIDGFDVLEKVAATKVKKASDDATEESSPVNPPVITSIRVETNGVDYGTPETHEPFDINSLFSQSIEQ